MNQPSTDFLHVFRIAIRQMDDAELDDLYRRMIEDDTDHPDTVAELKAELERRKR